MMCIKLLSIFSFCLLIAGTLASCKKCFPPDFLWGVATSAYQTEGAWNVSGKGENIWDWFTHNFPEKIEGASNGDIAIDSYHKYQQDVELLDNLGVNFFRFSLSWSRILPDGTTGNISEDGVNHYLNIFKKLRAKNIEPVVTLFHWDLPLPLLKLGGWANPKTADYFADYATLCYKTFGDYVHYWTTMNEPYIHCFHGYETGVYPPGETSNGTLIYTCFYTQLLAHAKAYRSYDESFRARLKGQVGIVLSCNWFEPLTNSEEDKLAAENSLQWIFGLQAHPIVFGNWPQVVIDRIESLSKVQGFNSSRLPKLTEFEIALIQGTFDYIGLNYYTTSYAAPIPNISTIEAETVSFEVDTNAVTSTDDSWPRAKSVWLFDVPYGLRKLLGWVSNTYGNPRIFITENGWSDGMDTLNDSGRIDYLKGHLCNLLKAKYVDGVNVIGYTYWSLMDSFEWNAGYTEGFGLVAVDFASKNLTRTPKASYYYYRNIIKTGCLEYCPFN